MGMRRRRKRRYIKLFDFPDEVPYVVGGVNVVDAPDVVGIPDVHISIQRVQNSQNQNRLCYLIGYYHQNHIPLNQKENFSPRWTQAISPLKVVESDFTNHLVS